jgi:hypothetical protein
VEFRVVFGPKLDQAVILKTNLTPRIRALDRISPTSKPRPMRQREADAVSKTGSQKRREPRAAVLLRLPIAALGGRDEGGRIWGGVADRPSGDGRKHASTQEPELVRRQATVSGRVARNTQLPPRRAPPSGMLATRAWPGQVWPTDSKLTCLGYKWGAPFASTCCVASKWRPSWCVARCGLHHYVEG